jgi:DNA-binding GntR family transcriptional regulator
LVTGKFIPGQVLSNRALAEAMDTSPIPVREALRRLVSERGLVVRHNGSVAVPPFSAAQFTDLRRVRCIAEGAAVEMAAERLRGADIERLERHCASIREAFESGSRERYLLANTRFHFTIYGTCESAVLLSIIDSLWLQLGPFLNLTVAREAFEFRIVHQLNAVAAIRRGDARGARDAGIRDIMVSGDFILSHARRADDPDLLAAPMTSRSLQLGEIPPCT